MIGFRLASSTVPWLCALCIAWTMGCGVARNRGVTGDAGKPPDDAKPAGADPRDPRALAKEHWVALPPPPLETDEGVVSLIPSEVGWIALVRRQRSTGDQTVEGYEHRLLVSQDGAEWEEMGVPKTDDVGSQIWLTDVAHGDGRFVVAGSSSDDDMGFLWHSDGDVWELAEVELSGQLYRVKWIGERFYALGTMGAIVASDDGRAWDNLSQEAGALADADCGPDRCVFASTSQLLVLDREAEEFHAADVRCERSPGCVAADGTPSQPPMWLVFFAGDRYYARTSDLGRGKFGFHSEDGETWTEIPPLEAPETHLGDVLIRRANATRLTLARHAEPPEVVAVDRWDRDDRTCADYECVVLDRQLYLVPSAPR